MTDGFDEIFSSDGKAEKPTEIETPTTEVTETETVEETPKEEEVQTTAPEPEKVEEAPKPEDRRNYIPIDAMLEERTKRQEAERRIAELERQYQEAIQKADAEKLSANRPDPIDNPDDYHRFVVEEARRNATAEVQQQLAQFQRQQLTQAFNLSKEEAVKEHGEEAVNAALAWAEERSKTDEAWGQQGLTQPKMVQWFVNEKHRHARIEELLADEEGFIARRAAEMGLVGQAQAAPAPSTKAEKVSAPKSLAKTGSNITTDPNHSRTGDDSFDAIFKR